MPLTEHGRRMMNRMEAEYGEKKGKQVLYASANAGKPGFSDIHGAIGRKIKRSSHKGS